MNPIPLSAPNGDVYAYACGRCHQVPSNGRAMWMPETPGPISQMTLSSLERAKTCCTCRTCGCELPALDGIECQACRWWWDFCLVWWRLFGNGETDKACSICGSRETNYCRETPKCVDCDDGHGSNSDGRCRDCHLDALRAGGL